MKSRERNLLLLFFFLAFIVGVFVSLKLIVLKNNPESAGDQPSVIINNQRIVIEIADTPQKTTQGLSGRESLADGTGMLFIFEKPQVYHFWMKEMLFALDFVFISQETVVDLAENIPFPKEGEIPQSVIAKYPFDQVLEVNAGTINRLGIIRGQKVTIAK